MDSKNEGRTLVFVFSSRGRFIAEELFLSIFWDLHLVAFFFARARITLYV